MDLFNTIYTQSYLTRSFPLSVNVCMCVYVYLSITAQSTKLFTMSSASPVCLFACHSIHFRSMYLCVDICAVRQLCWFWCGFRQHVFNHKNVSKYQQVDKINRKLWPTSNWLLFYFYSFLFFPLISLHIFSLHWFDGVSFTLFIYH